MLFFFFLYWSSRLSPFLFFLFPRGSIMVRISSLVGEVARTRDKIENQIRERRFQELISMLPVRVEKIKSVIG